MNIYGYIRTLGVLLKNDPNLANKVYMMFKNGDQGTFSFIHEKILYQFGISSDYSGIIVDQRRFKIYREVSDSCNKNKKYIKLFDISIKNWFSPAAWQFQIMLLKIKRRIRRDKKKFLNDLDTKFKNKLILHIPTNDRILLDNLNATYYNNFYVPTLAYYETEEQDALFYIGA